MSAPPLHPFLLHEGVWTLEGHVLDRSRNVMPLSGRWSVSHAEEPWTAVQTLTMGTNPAPQTVEAKYTITPFRDDAAIMPWQAGHSALGNLSGWFAVVDDAIMTTYSSADGKLVGSETLIRQLDGRYRGRGHLLENGAFVSSWTLMMEPKG